MGDIFAERLICYLLNRAVTFPAWWDNVVTVDDSPTKLLDNEMTCESANRATHSPTTKKEKLAAESLSFLFL